MFCQLVREGNGTEFVCKAVLKAREQWQEKTPDPLYHPQVRIHPVSVPYMVLFQVLVGCLVRDGLEHDVTG
jgi:hypothetical protein